jgi:hypothetical protein
MIPTIPHASATGATKTGSERRRVDAVAAVPVVLVQDPLFGLEALT